MGFPELAIHSALATISDAGGKRSSRRERCRASTPQFPAPLGGIAGDD
jgi:hypothetical protein